MSGEKDIFGIVANVLSDRVLRTGARVWLYRCNGDAECPIVSGMSKGGRRVEKYTHYKRLTNFRAAWVPEHLRDRVCLCWATKDEANEAAQRMALMWGNVRYFNRDGTVLVKDGISPNAAFQRARRTDP